MGIKRDLTNMFDSIERRSCATIEGVADLHLFRRLGRVIRGLADDSTMIRPEPWELVRSTVGRARRGAVAWTSDDMGYPTAFTVRVSREAWERFYRHETAAIARRVASEVARRLAPPRGTAPRLRITIECDTLLYRGDFDIDASFDLSEAPCGGTGARPDQDLGSRPRDSSGTLLAGAPVEAAACPAGEPVGHGTVLVAGRTVVDTVLEGADDRTGQADDMAAEINFGQASFRVVDGTTIGAPNHRQNADIELPINENRYVSGVHGRFERTAQGWVYEQLGPNGSTLIQDKSATKLAAGSREVVGDGAILELPHVEERILFRAPA